MSSLTTQRSWLAQAAVTAAFRGAAEAAGERRNVILCIGDITAGTKPAISSSPKAARSSSMTALARVAGVCGTMPDGRRLPVTGGVSPAT